MKKFIVEFIGTFFLVFTIIVSVNGGTPAGFAPLAIGAVLMAMVYAGGHISGAHYNPAVTVAVFLRGKCTISEVFVYWIAQLAGAAVAAYVGKYIVGLGGGHEITAKAIEIAPSLLAEFLGTFVLCFVVLNVATSKSTAGNSNYGLAIGFTVTAMAYTLGGISGGAFNPAVATGVAFANMLRWADIWVFFAAEIGAAILAAIVYKIVYSGHKEE